MPVTPHPEPHPQEPVDGLSAEALVSDLRAANAALMDALLAGARAAAATATAHYEILQQLAVVNARFDDAITTLTARRLWTGMP